MKAMNKLIAGLLVFGLCSTGTTLLGQDDVRSSAPEPGPARKIEIGQADQFELDNGIKVIVVENHKVPRISWQLYLDRDAIVEGDKAGYTSMAGTLLKTGTTTKSKAEIDEAIDFVGGSMSTSSRGGFASSLTKHSDKILEIFADVILNPTFPVEEFDKLKNQTISGLQTQKDDPSAIASNVSGALVYGLDHPYGELTTETTVANIGVEDCKAYYDTYFKPNIAYMVVVGDITPAQAKKKVEKYFGDWEQGDVPTMEYDYPELNDGMEVSFVDKAGAVQSVVNLTHAVPMKPGDPDVIPSRVMNTILGSGFSGRLFRNLREDKGYTYGAYSSMGSDELVGRFTASASVRNEVTDSAVTEFVYELNQMRDTDVTDTELELAKNFIAGSFARNLESPQTVANFALNTSRYNLPEDYYATYLEKLDAVDVAKVREMANKYIMMDHMRLVVVGNQEDVAESLEQFATNGEIKYYDIYANEKAAAEDAGDVSGEEIINAYVEALGGKDVIAGIKSMKSTLGGNAMGQELELVEYRMAPDKYSMAMNMMGQTMMRQVYNSGAGFVEQMGQKQDLEGEMLDMIAENVAVVPEMAYLGDGYEMSVGGVEEVNGEMCDKVTVTKSGDDKSSTVSFEKYTGLKVKAITPVEMGGQSATNIAEYSDYREVDGFMVPYVQKVSGATPVPLSLTVKSVEINSDLDPAVFD